MSIKFTTKSVIIEGPDCSGKTTLYQNIHKKTGFLWNIQDRSYLSMVCYARQYGRDPSAHRKRLMQELLDINNRVVVLLPSKETVLHRLDARGDDFQNRESIIDLHAIFAEEVSHIRGFSNVFVVEEEMNEDDLANLCANWLSSLESVGPVDVGHIARDATVAAGGNATVDIFWEQKVTDAFADVMIHPREGVYYYEILRDCFEIFSKERAGHNPYGKPQGNDSRRFYYSSSSCISSVHFLVRNGLLKVLVVLRSTDVHRNASIDLKFLCHLSSCIALKCALPIEDIEVAVRLNCAHVRHDLPKWDKDEVEE